MKVDFPTRFNSCVLFYALKSSDRPFAASLIGINARNHAEEELDHSRQFSFATASESPSEKNFGLRSCSTPVTPTPQRRGRRSWLPRLEFQLSPAYEHPPFQNGFDQMALAHSQPNLLLSLFPRQPAKDFSLPYVSRSHTAESANHISLPSLSRNSTVTTISSSIYSHTTNSETDLSRSLNTASHSYNSNTRSAGSTPEVPVSAVPERYLYESHTLRNGGYALCVPALDLLCLLQTSGRTRTTSSGNTTPYFNLSLRLSEKNAASASGQGESSTSKLDHACKLRARQSGPARQSQFPRREVPGKFIRTQSS